MKKNLTHLVWLVAVLLFLSPASKAQNVFNEPFPNSGLLTANGWTAHSGAGTNPISTTTGLTYAGLSGSGTGFAALVNNLGGEDDNKALSAVQNTDGQNIYVSALINVTEASTSKGGDYVFHLAASSGSGITNFAARVFVRTTASGVNFGLSNTSTATWGTTNFTANTTYLVILKYTISVAGNDPVSMWVIPSGVPASEAAAGTPEVTNTTTLGQNSIGSVALRQGSNTASAATVIDNILVGLTWGDVTPAAGAASLSISGSVTGLSTTSGAASSSSSFNLSGANLSPAAGNITVSSANTNFEVSLSSGSGFGASVLVPYTGSTLASTPIYVRISASATAGAVSSVITASGGTATDATTTATGNVLAAEPTVQATNVVISNIANNSFDVNWTNGNGAGRIVVVRQTSTAAVAPVDGTAYTIPATTGTGNTIVFVGTGSGPVSVTGLTAGTNYTVQVYEYNGTTGSTNYLTATATGNPATALTTGVSPNVTQSNFISNAAPLYGASGNTSRLPVMFYATVSGLTPSTTYRYYTQASLATDFGGGSSGAGNPILIDYTVNPVTYAYSSGPSLTTANNYGKFTTDANGNFSGSFGYVNTGNAKFTAGNVIYPTITLGLDASPTVLYRFALNQGITILQFATTAGVNDGTFIKGQSSATPGNIVGLWKSIDGNLVAARPLYMTLVENPTFAGAAWAASFVAGYDVSAGAWNAMIPNILPEGVRLIQQFNVSTGAVIGCNSDADGVWPSGANTVNPNGGSATPIQITVTDAPLTGGSCFAIVPVKISTFAVQKLSNNARISWTTEQEVNSKEFIVERSSNGTNWSAIATITAAGNSTTRRTYNFIDQLPAKGVNYYRLRMVDMDNKYGNSEVKSLLFSAANEVMITPNPAVSTTNLYIDKPLNTLSQIVITDMNGKVMEKSSTLDQQKRINTTAYPKGMYVVKVTTGDNTSTQKLIVQ